MTRGEKSGAKEYECRYKKVKELKFKELYQASMPSLDNPLPENFGCSDSDSVLSSFLVQATS